MERTPGFLVDSTPGVMSPEEEAQGYDQLANITVQLSKLRFPLIGPICQDGTDNFHVGGLWTRMTNGIRPLISSLIK